MKEHYFLYIVGVIIFLLPFLGFPSMWKNSVLILLGLCVIGFAVIGQQRKPVRPVTPRAKKNTTATVPFVENSTRATSVSPEINTTLSTDDGTKS